MSRRAEDVKLRTQGLTIGTRFGLDPEVMTDVLNVSTGMSWVSKTHIKQRITNRAFDDPFRLEVRWLEGMTGTMIATQRR